MAGIKSRTHFIETEEGREIRHQLQLIDEDASYNTVSSYSANDTLYPNNQIPFVDKHMSYLVSHPLLDPEKYLANVRLLTRVR